ncbi:hypothetical protein DMA11_10225 [Marinilabiliaceae bacterium JC017]|nr:hypothetical protein DMA11_10225 [Marinilabiliaceae bacterium JC017]
MIPDISLAMDYVHELHPRDLGELIKRAESFKAATYEYKIGKTIITVDDNRNRIWIEAEYGHFTYAWGAPGKSFKEFLTNLNKSYVVGKMRIEPVFDNRASFAALRKAIKEAIPYYKEMEFQKSVRDNIKHGQKLVDDSTQFMKFISEMNTGFLSSWYLLEDKSLEEELRPLFSEPWEYIRKKESTTEKRFWKDFQKFQNILKQEVQP